MATRGELEGAVTVLCPVDETRVLCRTRSEPFKLLLWNPVDGACESLTRLDGPLQAIWCH